LYDLLETLRSTKECISRALPVFKTVKESDMLTVTRLFCRVLQGDSGGPLVALVGRRWRLQGITSFGSLCAGKDYTTFVGGIIFIGKNTQ